MLYFIEDIVASKKTADRKFQLLCRSNPNRSGQKMSPGRKHPDRPKAGIDVISFGKIGRLWLCGSTSHRCWGQRMNFWFGLTFPTKIIEELTTQ
jgi:hypothetical protein